MLEPSHIVNSRLRDALTECFSLADLKFLSWNIGINPDKIVIAGRALGEAALALMQECAYKNKQGSLVTAILDERANCPAAKRLESEILKRKIDSPPILASITEDLKKDDRVWSLLLGLGPKINIISEFIVRPTIGHTITYYSQLRSKMSQCSVFYGLIGKTLDRSIKDLGRSQFEAEYDCAFLRGLPIYFFIDAAFKDERNFKGRKDQWKRVTRMIELQTSDGRPGNIYFYQDSFDLCTDLQNKIDAQPLF